MISKKSYKKEFQKEIVFVPLVALRVVSLRPKTIDKQKELNIDWSLNIKDGSIYGIEFIVFDNGGTIERFGEANLSPRISRLLGEKFQICNMLPAIYRYSFNSGLAFYMKKQKNGITIFPHQFEDKVRNVITFLRLFAPGDVFVPITLVNNYDISELHFSGIFEEEQSYIILYKDEAERFKGFFENYTSIVTEAFKESQNDRLLTSWYKRINNAVYFFNQSYFSRKSNRINPNARHGNEMRLIFLITALDALCGTGGGANRYTKRLAQNCFYVLGRIYPKLKERIEYFYELRSNYIHANEKKLVNYILDKDIGELRLYIQKLILVNFELLSSAAFKQNLRQSKKSYYFEYLEKVPNSADLKMAFQGVFKWQDKYGLPYNADFVLKN